MNYITGDTHGNQFKWVEQIDPVLKTGDRIIVAGDFGMGFWNGRYWSEETFFDWLARQPYTVLFCDGNHEDFDKLEKYPVTQWNGGRVQCIRPNVIHLMRGEVYDLDGQRIFVFGGGYSMDKAYREPGVSWWPQEMPSAEEYQNGEVNLDACGRKVDCMITHTAPSETVYALSTMFRGQIKPAMEEEFRLNSFLDVLQRTVEYQRWYFGHFHVDAELWRNQTVVFSTIRQLETGKIVHRWPSYEKWKPLEKFE